MPSLIFILSKLNSVIPKITKGNRLIISEANPEDNQKNCRGNIAAHSILDITHETRTLINTLFFIVVTISNILR